MAQVEIFKTNVTDHHNAVQVLLHLQPAFPGKMFNFDLEDCDCILRVEGTAIDISQILKAVHELGYSCEPIH